MESVFPSEYNVQLESYLEEYFKKIQTVLDKLSGIEDWKLNDIETYLAVLHKIENVLNESQLAIAYRGNESTSCCEGMVKCCKEIRKWRCFLIKSFFQCREFHEFVTELELDISELAKYGFSMRICKAHIGQMYEMREKILHWMQYIDIMYRKIDSDDSVDVDEIRSMLWSTNRAFEVFYNRIVEVESMSSNNEHYEVIKARKSICESKFKLNIGKLIHGNLKIHVNDYLQSLTFSRLTAIILIFIALHLIFRVHLKDSTIQYVFYFSRWIIEFPVPV